MLVASVSEEVARSGRSGLRGEDGRVEMEEGGGVLSEVRDASESGGLDGFGFFGNDARRADQLGNCFESGRQW